MSKLRVLSAGEQLAVWEARVQDERGVASTGWVDVDNLLHRGGFAPSTLVVVGGRTQTRKSTWCLSLAYRFLLEGTSVGWIGLDESTALYVSKFMSSFSGIPHEILETKWDNDTVKEIRDQYKDIAERFTMSEGFRPDYEALMQWWKSALQPQVVFIDYTSLLSRDQFAGAEVQRISRLIEELQVWANQTEAVVFTIHQSNRDGGGNGDEPLDLTDLKYGGEEIADVVYATYRPALSKLGNMDRREAEATLGDSFDEGRYAEAVSRVRRYQDSTFVQLLKNRPGTKTDFKGVEFVSSGEALKMRPLSETGGNT